MFCQIATLVLGFLSAVNSVAVVNRAPVVDPAPVDLGTAGGFTILAQAGISTVPQSSVTGNIGVSPISATALTGFSLTLDSSGTFSTSRQVTGKVFAATYASPTPSQLTTAVSDMQTAYTNASGRVNPDFTNLAGGNIGGLTLTPGLYKFTGSVNAANGVFISGSPLDTWIFQIAGTYSLSTGVSILLTGGALHQNIVWVVAGAVTLHVGSHHEGVILGKTSITAQTESSVNGRLLAQTNVALQFATITA